MDWSYIAGFFDGEGTVCIPNTRVFRVRISIPQTNEEVLVKIRDWVGCGTVCSTRKRKEHWKDAWVFCLSATNDVRFFLGNMMPYLVLKKKAAAEALLKLETYSKIQESKLRDKYNRKEKGLELIGKGFSIKQVSILLGVHRETVRNWTLGKYKYAGVAQR